MRTCFQHPAISIVNGEVKYDFLKVVSVKPHCPLTVIGETHLQASPRDNFYFYVQRKSLLNGVGLEGDLQHHTKQAIFWAKYGAHLNSEKGDVTSDICEQNTSVKNEPLHA